MRELALDILLPETDRTVAVQTLVMAVFWAIVIAVTWRKERDVRHFVWGLAMLNVAWFAARTVH